MDEPEDEIDENDFRREMDDSTENEDDSHAQIKRGQPITGHPLIAYCLVCLL